MMEKMCKRCGHRWQPRVLNPVRCPKCQSPYWYKDRKGCKSYCSLSVVGGVLCVVE